MSITGANTLQAHEFLATLDGADIDTIVSFEAFAYVMPDDAADKPLLIFYKRVEDAANTPFNKWLAETLASTAPASRPRHTFVVTAVNDGVPVRRWTFHGAWIAMVAQGSFRAADHGLVLEQISLGYDSVVCDILG